MTWKALLLSILLLISQSCFAAVEDFTGYTEQDEDGKVTITATKVASDGADTREKLYYVYDDKTVGHFGDYEHLATINAVGSTNIRLFAWWGVSNDISDVYGWQQASADFQTVYTYNVAEDVIFLDDVNGSDTYLTSSGTYYITVERAGTTGTCKIYSDFARTDLLDTLTLTVTNTTFRYVYAFAGYDNNQGSAATGATYTENLDLQEAPPSVAPMHPVINITKRLKDMMFVTGVGF